MSKVIQTYYEPRQQFVSYHERAKRWACIVFHRRGGKTVACVNDLHGRALYTTKKNARYAYIAPYYRQAKEIAWMYLKDATRDSAVKVKESELSVELFNGAKIALYGADNPDALRGIYLDGVILDEFGDCRPALWGEVVFPTLTDRKGWATFIGTPKGKNHFYHIRESARNNPDDWYYLEVPASKSGLLDQQELDIARKLMDDDQYEQEFECSFDAAVKGTYFSSMISELEANGHIGEVNADPEIESEVSFDLGYTDSTAMWVWQTRVDGLAVHDFEEHSGERIEFYLDILRSKSYAIKTLWLPHDAKAKTLQTGRSTVELVLAYIESHSLPWDVQVIPKLDLQDGISAIRYILPRCHIDQKRCFNGIEALRAYRRGWDDIKKVLSDRPVHDWSSHPTDSFRGLALVSKERVDSSSVRTRTDNLFVLPATPTLNDLFAEREKRQVAWRRSSRI